MTDTPIDRESVEVLAQIFSQDRDAFTAKTLLALRAALDKAEADKQLAVAAALERAFHEGFDVAASLTPHVHEVMQRKDEAWRKSRAIRAQEET